MSILRRRKNFRLLDAVLASVCIVLVVESVVPTAAIGPMQYFWWGLFFLAFFLPYGLISAELGSTYEDKGGLFDWVKRAFGVRNGARVAWYYWVNFPLWIASLATLFTVIYATIFNTTLPTLTELIIQLGFIWLIIWLGSYRISESKWLINSGALAKVLIIFAIGGLGIWGMLNHGVAPSTVASSASILGGLSFISMIIFNFLGFEVMSAFTKDMPNPRKEVPRAIIIGGILIAAFYLFAAFGVSVAIPADQLSLDSGLLDAFAILVGSSTGWPIIAVGLIFMFTLITNLVSWSPGVNYVATYAAKNKALPKVFALENKNGTSKGANIINGLVASALVIASYFLIENGGDVDVFWTFFALNIVTFIASYIFLFPAFLKLRSSDPNTKRPFKVPGGKFIIKLVAIVPLVILVVALIFTFFPYDSETDSLFADQWLLIGSAAAFVVGEVIGQIAVMRNRKKA